MGIVKILFIYHVDDEVRSIISAGLEDVENKIQLIYPEDLSKGNLELLGRDADCIIGRGPWLELLENADKLKLYIQPGTGIDRLSITMKNYSKYKDIIITNIHGSAYSCAQHSVAMLLTLTNKLFDHHNNMIQGKWRTNKPQSTGLRNVTVGLLGYGPINQFVHSFLRGFEIDFAVLKRSWSNDDNSIGINESHKFTKAQIDEFMEKVDIVMIAAPLTSETEGLIGSRQLELLGSDGYLVTVARGPIVDQQALYEALYHQRIAGAGLDVWYNYSPEEVDGKSYPYDENFPFHKLDNVILSPHRSHSPSNQNLRYQSILHNIRCLALGESNYVNIVNIDQGY
ncbi:MAG: hypothetical protein OEZ01_03010 [Candidatus Heimdallarchaeota archaeon]|nr:hypothetical protein [Candidatus Heimdallarchaeota archaeon]MDH5644947.1 hypothetical protein [Candidatus Heimdallarchaeota archaeon]